MFALAPHARGVAPADGIIRNGLVSRWPFDDGTGSTTARDDQSTNIGTLIGMDPQTAWVEGRLGGDVALRFAGQSSGEHVLVPDADELDAPSLTWTIWFRYHLNPSNWAGIIGKTNTSWNMGYGLFFAYGFMQFFYGNYNNAARFTLPATDRSWRFAVGTFDGPTNTKRIYIDDVEGTPNSNSESPQSSSEDLLFGFMPAGTNAPIIAQDGRLYNRVLSAAEQTQIFQGNG